ncbi:hypothetical protein B7463_g11844, partial [Scytalidium lignicola]
MAGLVDYGSSGEEDNKELEFSNIDKHDPRSSSVTNGTTFETQANGKKPEEEESAAPEPVTSSNIADPPLVGPVFEPTAVPDLSMSEILDEGEAPQSPYCTNRALLRNLTLPTTPNYDIPPSPPGSPAGSTDSKFKHFLELKKQGTHFNEKLARSSALKNPSLMQKLMDFADVSETGQYSTTLPHELWNPKAFPEYAYKEELGRSQKTVLKKKEEEKARGHRETVEFVPATISTNSSRGGTPAATGGRGGQMSAAERIMAGLDRGRSNSPQVQGVKRKTRSVGLSIRLDKMTVTSQESFSELYVTIAYQTFRSQDIKRKKREPRYQRASTTGCCGSTVVQLLQVIPGPWVNMAPREKSQLKRGRGGAAEEERDASKKPRRSERLSQHQNTPVSQRQHLPSPITQDESLSSSEAYKEGTATPPEASQIHHREQDTVGRDAQPFSSPPQDTQAFSQFIYPPSDVFADDKDEVAEGVWGYLLPLDLKYGKSLVLKKRSDCSSEEPKTGGKDGGDKRTKSKGKNQTKEEETPTKKGGISSGRYLIGRHPECDLIIDDPIVSNRHCLIFTENKGGDTVAVIEDVSANGTFVNDHLIGRNNRRELQDQDEITILDKARFVFRYPKNRNTSAFSQQYTLLEKLGKGHFAEVFLCVEKATGQRYAVKIFTGVEDRSKNDGLQQEIAVLMGVNHPNMLCLKDTFYEPKAVYLILELAPEGELFNWIVMKQKLTEDETRKVFLQLFHGVKYLHERGIVHRDIKPENILLTDKNLHVKLADFGLAKIIGEESFTTTLCGTPSYVAPEILEDTKHRRYTKAVDIWSLGVVLYICLCGFPPFSDELYSRENPYSLTQQIKQGRFDYPSPYWDSVGDPALDLIDRMLTVDVDKRYTIDDCLEHPWTTQRPLNLNDSTDGLVGGLAGLDFSKRKMARERTLLSSINDIKVTRVIDTQNDKTPVKVYVKNPNAGPHRVNNAIQPNSKSTPTKGAPAAPKEATPASNRKPKEFMALGGKGDQELYEEDDDGSKYS